MKSLAVLVVSSFMGSFGCATAGHEAPLARAGWSGIAWHGDAVVRVGETRVVDPQVNPLGSVAVAPAGDAISISYARSGRTRTVARLDAASLDRLPSGAESPGAPMSAVVGATRVVLKGNRFLLVWRRGSVEWGERAMAQEFGVDGRPHGAPVFISPPDVDVMGTPQAATTDGRHVVVTYAGASGQAIALMAVSVDPQDADIQGEPLADRRP